MASRRNRGADYGGPGQDPADAGRILAERGIDPLSVGQRVLEGVKANEDYVLTHWDFREQVEKRHRRIRAAFDYWEKSPAVNTLPKREPPPLRRAARDRITLLRPTPDRNVGGLGSPAQAREGKRRRRGAPRLGRVVAGGTRNAQAGDAGRQTPLRSDARRGAMLGRR